MESDEKVGNQGISFPQWVKFFFFLSFSQRAGGQEIEAYQTRTEEKKKRKQHEVDSSKKIAEKAKKKRGKKREKEELGRRLDWAGGGG